VNAPVNDHDVVIVEAVRTPIGRFRGGLAQVRADHLGAIVLNALVERAGITAQQVDDVIFGCVTQVGEQSANIARTALLSAGWPVSIPGMTVDRKCGSSEAAVHVAAGLIAAGALDIAVAGGAENMSRVPLGGNRDVHGEAFGWKYLERFQGVGQGEAAERLADGWSLTREELDAYALQSHQRAAQAIDAGYFLRETVTVPVQAWREQGDGELLPDVAGDEGVRRTSSMERLAGLKTSFREKGRITAGNSSQISDGAAGVLLASREAALRMGLKPRAVIRGFATCAVDPDLMLTGPVSAARKVLVRAGLDASQVELFEINEAFASVPLVWMKEMGVGAARVNVNGGAIALGHPLGATGARLMTSLLHEMERQKVRYGLQAMCCAGGLGTATLIERCE
jgi:acetyl-CoA acyltransferase